MQAYTAHKHQEFGIWSHLLKKSLMENFIFCAAILILTQVL